MFEKMRKGELKGAAASKGGYGLRKLGGGWGGAGSGDSAGA